MENKKLHTKYGTANIGSHGYYRITSEKEGNCHKLLHRLIFEDFYGYIPDNFIVHHKDGNKLNNCIMNLELISKNNHASLHHDGRIRSEETRLKISKALKGNKLSDETKRKLSEYNLENSPVRKNYARIVKNGFKNNKQYYAINRDSKLIKNSVTPSKLVNWFTINYPNELLVLMK